MKKWIIALYLFVFLCGSLSLEAAPLSCVSSLASCENRDTTRFSDVFENYLNAYFSLSNSFYRQDSVAVVSFAFRIQSLSDLIPADSFRLSADLRETVASTLNSIKDDAIALQDTANSVQEKLTSFYSVSEELYDLLRIIRYPRGVFYHFSCEEALAGQGATWISRINKIENPYLPQKQPICGELADSLNYKMSSVGDDTLKSSE